MHYQRVEATVKDIIARQFKVPYKDLAPETKLVDDLGADSLDMSEIALGVEEAFETDIPDSDLEGINSVASMARYIQERLEADAA